MQMVRVRLLLELQLLLLQLSRVNGLQGGGGNAMTGKKAEKAVFLSLVLAAIVGGHAAGRRASFAGESAPAHTVVLRETRHDPDGRPVGSALVTSARRTDGSHIRFWETDPSQGRVGTLFDAAAGSLVSFDEMTMTRTTLPLGREELDRLANAKAQPCWGEAAEPAAILGVAVVRQVHEAPSAKPGGPAIQVVQWRAPSLGCAVLREVHRLPPGNGGEGRVILMREAIRLAKGEPAPELFRLPEGLQERSPVQALEHYYRTLADTPCLSCPGPAILDAEQKYWQRRK